MVADVGPPHLPTASELEDGRARPLLGRPGSEEHPLVEEISQVLQWPAQGRPIRARGSTLEGRCLGQELRIALMKMARGRGWTSLQESVLEPLRSQVCHLVQGLWLQVFGGNGVRSTGEAVGHDEIRQQLGCGDQ